MDSVARKVRLILIDGETVSVNPALAVFLERRGLVLKRIDTAEVLADREAR